MAWQSGLTGVGYNTELAIKPPTKLDDLMSTDYFPPATVGVLKSDAPDLVMVNLGIDPKTSEQPEMGRRRPTWLTKLRDSDTFYAAYDQGYVDDLTAENLVRHDGVVRRRPVLQDLGGQAARVHRARRTARCCGSTTC